MWNALARRDFLVSRWPWRALAYGLSTVPVLALTVPVLFMIGLPWLIVLNWIRTGDAWPPYAVGLLGVLGAALVGGLGPLLALPLAHLERRRLRLVDDRPVPTGTGRPSSPYHDPASWRALVYAFFLATAVPLAYAVVVLVAALFVGWLTSPFVVQHAAGPVSVGPAEVHTVGQAIPYGLAGLGLLPTVPYLVGLVAAGHAAVARALLGADRDDGALVEVTASRARLVDSFEAERRRIERDLHDGAQHRLTSLALQLGVARLEVAPDSPAARTLTVAHDQAKELMAVLRELVHGIRPQALSDLSLPAAVRELADRSAIPVRVVGSLAQRLPERIETTAYFTVAEALANVTKHSGATRVRVSFGRDGDLLVVEVADNGRGGADPARGTGLVGLADRVSVVDGRLLLASPSGVPTLVRVELPSRP
jgi:signal transduction histidine kinase